MSQSKQKARLVALEKKALEARKKYKRSKRTLPPSARDVAAAKSLARFSEYDSKSHRAFLDAHPQSQTPLSPHIQNSEMAVNIRFELRQEMDALIKKYDKKINAQIKKVDGLIQSLRDSGHFRSQFKVFSSEYYFFYLSNKLDKTLESHRKDIYDYFVPHAEDGEFFGMQMRAMADKETLNRFIDRNRQTAGDLKKELAVLNGLMDKRFELSHLRNITQVQVRDLPDVVTWPAYIKTKAMAFNQTFMACFMAIAADINAKSHTLANIKIGPGFAIDGLIVGSLGLVLQGAILVSLMRKKNKTLSDKIELSSGLANFCVNLVRFPSSMAYLAKDFSSETLRTVSRGMTHYLSFASGPLFILSALLMAYAAVRLYDLSEEQDKAKELLVKEVDDALYQMLGAKEFMNYDSLSLEEKLNAVFLSEGSVQNAALIAKVQVFKQEHPDAYVALKDKCLKQKLKYDDVRYKYNKQVKDVALNALTLGLMIVGALFPPTIMVTYPTLALITAVKFAYSFVSDSKNKAHRKALDSEFIKVNLLESPDEEDNIDDTLGAHV